MGRLDGKVALNSGAARGMGQAEARLFSAEGAKIALCDVRDAEGKAAAEEIGANAIYQHLDVTDEDEWEAAVAVTTRAFGKLDVLVNNAALGNVMYRYEEFPMDEWDRVNAINVRGVFALTKECLLLLEAAGSAGPHASVINIASIDGIRIAADNDWAYGSDKAALIHLTQQWAGRLGNKGGREGGRNITFNAIAPGPFPGMLDEILATEEGRTAVSHATVVGRPGVPEDMGAACLYLASRAGEYVTGAVLPVDGGLLVGRGRNS